MGLLGNLFKALGGGTDTNYVITSDSVTRGNAPAGNAAGSAANATMGQSGVIINGIDYSTTYNRNHDYFRDIIRGNFSNYEIEENVPVSRIKPGASSAFFPISYLLSQGGRPVAVIAIMPPFKSPSVRLRDVCCELNIPFITFFCQYENRESYVVNRINDKISKYRKDYERRSY